MVGQAGREAPATAGARLTEKARRAVQELGPGGVGWAGPLAHALRPLHGALAQQLHGSPGPSRDGGLPTSAQVWAPPASACPPCPPCRPCRPVTALRADPGTLYKPYDELKNNLGPFSRAVRRPCRPGRPRCPCRPGRPATPAAPTATAPPRCRCGPQASQPGRPARMRQRATAAQLAPAGQRRSSSWQ
jgi:hypothetical protein